MSSQDRSRVIKRAVVVVGVVVIAAVAWSGYQVWSSWNNVERVEFDTDSAREALGQTTVTSTVETTVTTAESTDSTEAGPTTTLAPTLLLDRNRTNTFLVIGSDESTTRADVILLLILPPGSGDAVMVSIPRDLWLVNPCYGYETKINANLFGCEARGVSGPEQMAIVVEDLTGIGIDHFATFTFGGFTQIIDRVGGVEICVGDYAVRDLNRDLAGFQLPAGCSTVDGTTALSWVRSRSTQIRTNAGWVGMPGVNDLTRNERQQELLLTALDTLKEIRSLPELQGLVEDVSNAFAIDEGLSLGDAIALLWDARTVSSDDIYRVSLDVRHAQSEGGEAILLLNTSFRDSLIAAYPRSFEFFDWND